MKKLKTFIMLLFFCSCCLILSACGKIKINIVTNIGNEIQTIEISGDTSQKDVLEKVNALSKLNYEVEGIYFDEAFSKKWNEKDRFEKETTLYIKWQGKEYDVIYNANNGSGSMENTTIRYNEAKNLAQNAFKKEGHMFLYWNTEADGTGVKIRDKALYTMSQKGITLYAVWSANSYLVKFDGNGATKCYNNNNALVVGGIMSNQSIEFGAEVKLNANKYVRDGYSFNGWNTKADGTGVKISDKASYTKDTTNIDTLYASWTAVSYDIEYVLDGGAIAGTNPTSYTIESAAQTLINPTKEGHTFKGWSGTGLVGDTNTSVTIASGSTDNREYTANWTANTYTIKFIKNHADATGEMSDLAMTYDVAKDLTTNAYTRTGYTFSGWATTESGSKAYDDGANVSNLTSIANAEVTLYAVWTANTYTIKFIKNHADATGEMSDLTMTYGVAKDLTTNAYTRIGYTFSGWATTESGSKAYADGANVSNLTSVANAEVTLYAVWIENGKYTIQFNANAADATGTTSPLTMTYGVAKDLTTNAYTRTGYTFSGWAESSEKEKVKYADKEEVNILTTNSESSAEVTLYAVWTANTYTIKFNANGGTGVMSDLAMTYDVAKDLTANTYTRTGYTFSGWATTTDGSIVYEAGESVSNLTSVANDEVTLYAVWIANTYAIKFNANNGAGEMDDLAMTYDVAEYLTANTYTRTGYTFSGWATTTDGSIVYEAGESVSKLTSEDKAVVNLYAVWTMIVEQNNIVYRIEPTDTLEQITGTDTNMPREYTTQTNAKVYLPVAARLGYTFTEWRLAKAAYLNGKTEEVGYLLPKKEGAALQQYIPEFSYGVLELTAIFEPIEYQVTYMNEDDTVLQIAFSDAIYTGGYQTLVRTVVSGYNAYNYGAGMDIKAGYVFDGWYSSKTLINADTRFNHVFGLEDMIVYPHYIKILDVPTDVTATQTDYNIIIKWKAVNGADSYAIKIDDSEKSIGYNFSIDQDGYISYDASSDIIEEGIYEISVKAQSNYISDLNRRIDSGFSEKIVFNKESVGRNMLISEKDNAGKIIKYVMFTGMKYIYDTETYEMSIVDPDDSITFSSEAHEDGSGHRYTIQTDSQKTGSFVISIDNIDPAATDEEYTAIVVPDVTALAYGEAYKQFVNSTSNNAQSLASLNPTNYIGSKDNVYMVGTKNAFALDFNVKYNSRVLDYDITNSEALTLGYSIYNEETLEFDAVSDGDALRPVLITEANISSYLESDEFAEVGMIKLPEAANGKKYKISMKINYARYDIPPIEFVFEVNDGWNAKDSAQLKKLYGTREVKTLNITHNITAELDSCQTQEDGSPINVQSGCVFDSDDTVSDNKTVGDERKTDGNIYKRAFGDMVDGEEFIINGNYMVIDASSVPVINGDYNEAGKGSGSGGINHQTSWNTSNVYDLHRQQTGVFRYQVPTISKIGETEVESVNENKCIFNNLRIIGNKVNGIDISNYYTNNALDRERYTQDITTNLLDQSGSFVGIFAENSKIVTNNIIVEACSHAIRGDGAVTYRDKKVSDETTRYSYMLNSDVELNKSVFFNTYCNAIYSWEGKAIRLFDSYIYDLNGPAVQIDRGRVITNDTSHSILAIDETTVINNYVSGTESWFTVWQMGALTNQLKTTLQASYNSMGASALKALSEGSKVSTNNFVFVFRPAEINTAGIGTQPTDYCTTFIGGQKATVEGFGNVTNGVKAERKAGDTNKDNRTAGGLYAFPITPYAESADFNRIAAVLPQLLTDPTNQQYMIGYALGNLTAWSSVSSQTVTGLSYTIGQMISEAEFAVIADNFLYYGVLTNVVKGSSGALNYDYFCNYVATNILGNSGFVGSVKAKLSSDEYTKMQSDYTEDRLIVLSELTGTNAGSFVIMKMSETIGDATRGSGAEDIDTQIVEILLPDGDKKGDAYMVVMIGFGFIDEEGWLKAE